MIYKNFEEFYGSKLVSPIKFYQDYKTALKEAWNAATEAARCPHEVNCDGGLSYCNLAETSVARLGNENVKLKEAVELAWGLIANAGGGDWKKETNEWQDAAVWWRDDHLNKVLAESSVSIRDAEIKKLKEQLEVFENVNASLAGQVVSLSFKIDSLTNETKEEL